MKWVNKKKLKCPKCGSVRLAKDGIVKGKQRYLCMKCGFRTIKPKGTKKKAS